jgi:hypothetical protein
MPYNQKYFFEFDTLKTANKVTKYYRVVFSKLEDIAYTYDLIELQAANSPFVLTYRSPEDNAFSPIKTSSAEINILYPYDPATGTPEPDEFLNNTTDTLWLVQLYELTSNGAVSALKWQGYLINDVQYEWQDAYYYRLVATDNLAVLKDVKYSDDTEFKCPDYLPLEGVSVKDFIIELVNKTGNTLNYKFAWELYNDSNPITLDILFTSKYIGIDWKTYQPKNIYPVLEDILRTLGCIIYQDNNDATWTILNVAEIGTRTDNEVPYTEYDSTGTFVTTGVIELNSSINKGENDLVWRDKNQIVSFLKPIGSYELAIEYIGKNLLQNYSFQEDDVLPDGWQTFGTFPTTIETDGNTDFGISYDTNYLDITASESNGASLDVTNYFYQNINLENTLVTTSTSNRANNFFSVLVEFKSYCNFSTLSSTGEGYNFQVWKDDPVRGVVFYDTTAFANNIDNGGNWMYGVGADASRIAVFADGENPYQKVTLLTRGIGLNDLPLTLRLVFLKFRYDFSVSSSGTYKIDETRMTIIPTKYKNINKFKYIATQNPKFNTVKQQSIFTGGFKGYDWYAVEGALGLKDINDKLYCNNLWDRHWEIHDESSINYLDSIVAKSIISFYRNISRKFTGNIWGEQISYPKYFEIESATNKNAPIEVANAFEARVLANIGECETVLCGSNYLTEYYELPAKFLMIEASFDYQQSTTSVNLHEDLTSTTETNFTAGFGGFEQGTGVFPQQIGASTTNFEQEPTEPS